MNSKEYMDTILHLRNQDYVGIHSRVTTPAQMDLLHSIIGMASEIGELVDAVKRHIFYGEMMDVPNLLEEFGDLFFYVALALDTLGYTFEDAMQVNIRKLAIRYPEGFTKSKALNRDLEAEKEAMEPVGYCDECLKQKNCSFTGDFEECNQRYCGHICQTCKHDGPEYKCLVGIKSDNKPITGSTDCSKWEKR